MLTEASGILFADLLLSTPCWQHHLAYKSPYLTVRPYVCEKSCSPPPLHNYNCQQLTFVGMAALSQWTIGFWVGQSKVRLLHMYLHHESRGMCTAACVHRCRPLMQTPAWLTLTWPQ